MASNKDPIIGKAIGELRGLAGKVGDLANRLDKATEASNNLEDSLIKGSKRASRAMDDFGNKIDDTSKKISGLEKRSSGFGRTMGKLSKGLRGVTVAITSMGIGALIDGIGRVIELKERWAKITGDMTRKIGALTPNFKGLMKASREAQGTIRGLTDDFNLGAHMFAEYSSTLETTSKRVMSYNKVWLQMARGMDLGAQSSGELVKSFRAIGISAPGVSKMMVQMTKDAELLDVNSQAVAKDLSEAGNLMARFGREGTKNLIQGAVFLKQFNISLKDTNGLMNTFDRFDSATEATAKLNTIFGTTISSMDMLLSQDPAERIERVRQELLAQGKTFETLSGFERKALAETLNIGEKEVAFLLDQEKAHISLAEFREKAAKQQVNEQRAQKQMQKQLQKTSEILFAWGIAMDKVTKAIGKALVPLLDALGLTTGKYGNKMKSLTDVIAKFFEELAGSQEWIDLMQKLADVMKKVAGTVKDFVMSGKISPWIDRIVGGLKKFMTVSAALQAVWTGSRAMKMLMNLGKIGGMKMGSTTKGLNVLTKMTGKGAALRLGGLSAGLAAGSYTGGGTKGGNIGSLVGGGLGMLIGPAGAALGATVGGFIGKKLQEMLPETDHGSFYGDQFSSLKLQQSGLSKGNTSTGKINAALSKQIISKRRIEAQTLELAAKARGKNIQLNKHEAKVLRDVAKEAADMGVNVGISKRRLLELTKDGVVPSKKEINLLAERINRVHEAADKSADKLFELANASQSLQKIQLAKSKIEHEEAKVKIDKERAILELRQSGEKNLLKLIESGKIDKALKKAEDKAYDSTEALAKAQATVRDWSTAERSNIEGSFANNNLKLAKANLKVKEKEFKAAEKRLDMLRPLANTELKLHKLKLSELKLTDEQLKLDGMRIKLQGMEQSKRNSIEKFIGGGSADGLSKEDIIFANMMKDSSSRIDKLTGMATGGIVTRPTSALIGESGPEAVIPLRTLARGRGHMPAKFGGGAAKKLVNYASGGSSGGSSGALTVVAGDVYLDGQKVGRHIVRSAIKDSDY